MPPILNLKFKGNKSFVAFSNLGDTEALTKTWKVCSKVASYLEQGQRLENLSWRLWHLQSLMVDTDNAKSKREFKKLSKFMGDKLDKEKGRSIEELEAPDFRNNSSADLIRQRAVEKERLRQASQNASSGTLKRMQFTFSVDQNFSSASDASPSMPDLKPSPEFNHKRTASSGSTRPATRSSTSKAQPALLNHDHDMIDDDSHDSHLLSHDPSPSALLPSVHFPSYFANGFDASATFYDSQALASSLTYGEGIDSADGSDRAGARGGGFSVARPTIEIPFDDILNHATASDSASSSSSSNDHRSSSLSDAASSSDSTTPVSSPGGGGTKNVHMRSLSSRIRERDRHSTPKARAFNDFHENSSSSDDDEAPVRKQASPVKGTARSPAKGSGPASGLRGSTLRAGAPGARPSLTVRTQPLSSSLSSRPGATATSVSPSALREHASGGGGLAGVVGGAGGNTAPGGAKAECCNCGATHTPLWRRGLNDELNCNACGLYCKLHKRPRPKSMRNNHGESRAQAAPRPETVDVMAQCYNCHTTATPLWRKDDEGKTVCNACGLYYKLHGSPRPISMKSDVIRKRSRHDARRVSVVAAGHTLGDNTPSASPGASRRASPVMEPSPTLAPDSTTRVSYSSSDSEYLHRPTHQQHRSLGQQSELSGALGASVDVGMVVGQEPNPNAGMNMNMAPSCAPFGLFTFGMMSYPGPYHPDYLLQQHHHAIHHHHHNQLDSLPFATLDGSEMESAAVSAATSPSSRSSKRRRMSLDSVSEPPSSAVSYGSFDGYSSSAASSVSPPAMDYPYHQTSYPSFGVLRGSGNTYWHTPMHTQEGAAGGSHNSPRLFIHPPMLPPAFPGESDAMASTAGASSLDFYHPPMLLPQDEESLFSSFLHPPMALTDPEPVLGCASPPPVQRRASPATNGASSSATTMQVHPPMYPSEMYDSPMHSYG